MNSNKATGVEMEPLPENLGKTVKVHYGIFFDGTRNHNEEAEKGEKYRALVDELKAKKVADGMTDKKAEKEAEKEAKKELNYKASFASKKDRTNVARLEPYFDKDSDKYICRHYIEGIGTDEKGNSSLIDQADGFGDTGVFYKVQKAIDNIHVKINGLDDFNKVRAIELNFELFGFSRGAAAARYFVSQVQDQLDNVESKLSPKNVNCVKFTYVGLFDTVSMYGPLGICDKRLNLDAIKDADYVLHICAGDDDSSILPLTDIKSAKDDGKGEEIFIPGDHSDIGGGHPNGIYSNISMSIMYKNANSKINRIAFLSDSIEKSQPIQGEYLKELVGIKDSIEALAFSSKSQEDCRSLFSQHYKHLMDKKYIHCSNNTKKRKIING